ncbi:MAG: DUF4926 domain-containing protein [Oscillospiraceae bacterium]|nr:DUF4926 domain-containing protein [Oscillospiraceae bacterium]
MFEEYASVQATKDLSDNVIAGCIGVIVFIYNDPRLAYEVEFFDDKNNTIDVLTVEPDDIELKS